ncbi:hypothetical protein Tco_0859193 [Tanacetum coccineum]|uniref:Reverse transcriptase domain-containing protein n=1 Tax=Tanacetum coccineum TaxID=301880 RepID=A0ABQ5BEZ4_9ASTR
MPVCDDSSSKNEDLDDIVSIPPRKEFDHLDAIPDSIQSFLNHANSIIFLIEEFAGELAPINPIVEADPEKDIRLIEKLLNDDSSPHSPKELNSEIPDAIIESFSPSPIRNKSSFRPEDICIPDAIIESFSPPPIPIEDSDSLIEEIDIFLAPDSLSHPEYETFHFDRFNVPSSLHPPEKPPDDDGIYFNIEPDPGNVTTKVEDDIFDNSTKELYVHVPNVLPTHPTLYPVFDTLLPFENEDKVFNPGILISKEEKSPHFLSHWGFKVFQLINDFESPMMIYGGDIPILDVPYLHFYPP